MFIRNIAKSPSMIKPGIHTSGADFISLYTSIREKEGRMYSDAEVAALPEIPLHHPLHNEWAIRARSAQKLKDVLIRKYRPLQILEIGCGNGWLSAFLSRIPGSQVTGIDVHIPELAQAKRIFGGLPNLRFLEGSIDLLPESATRYDIIVLAASAQYFPSVPALIRQLLRLLDAKGEIHILDSPFYLPDEVDSAKERSQAYYSGMGFPEMTEHYYHHSMDDLKEFECETLYKPTKFRLRLRGYWNPFPWFCITKEISG
jgi:SAM-dependent methyltransferase